MSKNVSRSAGWWTVPNALSATQPKTAGDGADAEERERPDPRRMPEPVLLLNELQREGPQPSEEVVAERRDHDEQDVRRDAQDVAHRPKKRLVPRIAARDAASTGRHLR